jgi:TonB family protein
MFMKKNNFKNLPSYILLCFLVYAVNLSGQAGKALEFYDSGNKAFSKKNYRAADSLFTLSINFKPTSDAYLKRANTRQKLNNKKGNCLDLFTASNFGNNEATILLNEQCVKGDTLYKDAGLNKTDTSNYAFKEVIATCDLIGSYDYNKYNRKGELLLSYYKIGADTIYRVGSEITTPGFPGGFTELGKFVSQNIQYPVSAKDKGLSGKVWISFIVAKDGSLKKINIFKGMRNCTDCDTEAMRIVSLMPKWIPGKRNGKPIEVNFRAPISFKIQ